MAITSSTIRTAYTGNGVQKVFTFPNIYYHESQLLVYVNGALQTLGSTYTVAPQTAFPGDGNVGGTVTFIVAPANGASILIIRSLLLQQTMILNDGANFPAKTIEKVLDQIVMMLHNVADNDARSLHVPITESGDDLTIPSKATRASQYLGFDSNGLPIAIGSAVNTALVSAYVTTLLDDADAAAARTTLGLGTMATQNKTAVDITGGTIAGITDLAVADGGTGASTAANARTNLEVYSKNEVDALNINPIINPCMEIWQRGTTFAAAVNGQYAADRWAFYYSNGGAITLRQSTNVPTVAQAGVAFNFSFEVDVTTADAAVAAGDYAALEHKIEGYNWRHFAQREFTISFWVMSTKTGTHCLALSNSGFDRSYVAEYTINAADTWEKKTITVSASPSAGTWNYTTSTGLELRWTLMSGTNFHTTAGSWNNGNYLATANQVNVMDNVANFFRITGVKMELGAIATPFRFRPYQQELAMCQRYFEVGTSCFGGTDVTNAVLYLDYVPYKVTKRIAANTLVLTYSSDSGFPANNPTNNNQSAEGMLNQATADATVNGGFLYYGWTCNSEL